MKIRKFINSVFNSNTFVLYQDNKAVIIDFGDYEPVHNFLVGNNLIPEAVLITHVHYDHIYGLRDFMKDYPEVPIYTTSEGKESFKNPKWNFSRYHNDDLIIDSPRIIVFPNILSISDFGDITGIPTPGHDHSCISFTIGDNLFTGDSYIPGVKVVNTFPKSDKELSKIWYSKLEDMSKKYNVYPGHGEIKLNNNN